MVLKLDNKEKKDILFAIKQAISDINQSSNTDEALLKKLYSLETKIEKSMKKIKPRSAKNKGLQFQKKIACVIGELIGIEASQDDDSLIQSRLSSQNGTDIILHGIAKDKFPYSVECKDCSSISLPAWISQAKENETEREKWLLFIHSQILDEKDIVVMSLDSFKNLFLKF